MAPLLAARVKSVLSGDTVNLVSLRASDGDPERQLSLAYVSAPRLTSNEPYGFEAREYLRTLLVGKQVQFKVLYSINGKEYGDIIAPVFPSLIEKVVGAGYAKVRDDAESKDGFQDLDLEAAQDKAKANSHGIWNSEAGPTVETVSSISAQGPLPAIIERVISGDRLQLRIPLSGSNQHFVGQVLIAGLKCPRSTSPTEPGQPLGDEAKSFVNSRLLQRSVTVQVVGHSNTGIPVVCVSHPAGNIAELLLNSGYAQVSDWHSALLGPEKMKVLRAAENAAKQHHKGLWATDINSGTVSSSAASNEVTVSKVISVDTIAIRDAKDVENVVQLASIRGPRKAESESLYNAAKEYLRSHLIGKKINVTVIHTRPKSDQFDERDIVVAQLNGNDIALSVVQHGWASVIKHKGSSADRSPIWDDLIAAENEATAQQKGIFSKKNQSGASRIVDASENAARARSFVSSFERQGSINGIIDHISSGGRYRLIIPRENCVLSLVLAGIRVPKPKEPHGDKALDIAVKKLWQRDVRISVQGVDKTGAFIGNLFVGTGDAPFSVQLVKDGLAEVHDFSAESSGYYNELLAAETAAKSKHLGLWEDYVEEEEDEVNQVTEQIAATSVKPTWGQAAAAPVPQAKPAVKYIDVKITQVDDDGNVYLRESSREASFTELQSGLTSYNNSAVNSAAFPLKKHPKNGEIVATSDGSKWARARIVQFNKPDDFEVILIDSGSKKHVSSKALRTLPSQYSTTAYPAFAKEAVLSYVEKPPHDYMEDYVSYLREKVVGKSVACSIDGQKSSVGPSNVTLYTAESKGRDDSVNNSLIYEGYAFVDARPSSFMDNSVLSSLKESQSLAKDDRIGVWEYGDPRDE